MSSVFALELVPFTFALELVSSASAQEPVSPTPRSRAFVPCPRLYRRAWALQAHTVYPGPLCCFSRVQPAEASQGWKRVDSQSSVSGDVVTLDTNKRLQKYIAIDA